MGSVRNDRAMGALLVGFGALLATASVTR